MSVPGGTISSIRSRTSSERTVSTPARRSSSQPVHGEQPSFNQRMTRVFMEGLGRAAKAGIEPVEGGGQAECCVVVAGGLV
jgi:hypothetical protein